MSKTGGVIRQKLTSQHPHGYMTPAYSQVSIRHGPFNQSFIQRVL